MRSALQDEVHSQFQLGCAYSEGEGVKQDYQQAMHWYQQAAAQGDSNAYVNIGWMYKQGHGVERDDEEALSWFHRAAEAGNVTAWYNLVLCTATGAVPQWM